MADGHQHFPTFSKAVTIATGTSRSTAIRTLVRLERPLLRGTLYGLLAVAGINYLLGRYLIVSTVSGMTPFGYRPPMGDESPLGILFRLTSFLFMPEQASSVVVLCLVGLAASCRTAPRVETVEAFEPSPAPPPKVAPTPPAHHPLDPDPDDPPIAPPPWKR